MKAINKNLWLVELPRITLVLFVFLNVFAMFCYSGGTYLDHFSPGYSFTQNFLSDLGRTISFSGKINFFSAQLFNMSLILSGLIFAVFYSFAWHDFLVSNNLFVLAIMGSFFGFLGGISLIGVGLSPADLYLDIHIICAHWLFRFFFMASLFYSFVILYHPKFENKYTLGYLVFSCSLLIYILISEFGPDPKENQFALTLQVISQKIILLILICSVYIQTLGIKKL